MNGNVAFCRRVGNPGFTLANGQMRDGIRTLEKRPLPVGPLQGDYVPIFSERNERLGVVGLLNHAHNFLRLFRSDFVCSVLAGDH